MQPSRVREVTHEGAEWWVAELDLREVKLGLLGQRPGEPQTFEELSEYLLGRPERLVVATNAGIFDPGRVPVGLHVEDGEELHALSTAEGSGNFFLKPNGVFWVDAQGAHVAATKRFAAQGKLELATQSGPLLLDHGVMHPSFSEPGTSLRVRSAVGVDAAGHVFFALSQAPVSFATSAKLFLDVLHCQDALYLDGEISALLTPERVAGTPHPYAALLVATLPDARARPTGTEHD
ncbi:MAG: phosphodiester glycosidase family protein [Myxococcales bacterium]